MANHGAAALLLMASLLVAVALSGAEARPTVRRSAVALRGVNVRRSTRLTVRRDAQGGYHHDHVVAAPAPVPEEVMTCNKAHGVQAGETCFSVGIGERLTQKQFFRFNPNIDCDNLFVGQWICLDATCA